MLVFTWFVRTCLIKRSEGCCRPGEGGSFGEPGYRGERDQGQSFRWLRVWLWLRVRLGMVMVTGRMARIKRRKNNDHGLV